MPAHALNLGSPGEPLNGAECRLLRTSLCLERRHVAGIASALWGDGELVTLAQVTSWERSKGKGYPEPVAELLGGLSRGVDALGRWIGGRSEIVDGARLVRRLSREEAESELRPFIGRVQLGNENLRVGRSKAGFTGQAADLWEVLVDAAMVRAVQTWPGSNVRVGARADAGATQEGRQ